MFVTSWGHVVLEGKHSGKISHIDSSRCTRCQTPENFSIVCFLNHSFCIRILYPDFGRLPSGLLPNSLLFSLTCCHFVKKCETFDLLLLCGRSELVPIYSQRLFRYNQGAMSSRSQRRDDEELRDKTQQYFFSKDFL